MEKQLLERALNGEMDEVDHEMLKARLRNVVSQLYEHIEAIKVLCNEHEDEFKILQLNIILAVDSQHEIPPVKTLALWGVPSFIQTKMIPEILRKLEK